MPISADAGCTEPGITKLVKQMVVTKGIGYHPEHAMTEVDAANKRLSFTNSLAATSE